MNDCRDDVGRSTDGDPVAHRSECMYRMGNDAALISSNCGELQNE